MKIYYSFLVLLGASLVAGFPTKPINETDEELPIRAHVVGGTKVDQGEMPFAVSVNIRGSQGGAFCTGFLITESIALTAAHCVENWQQVSIKYGDVALNNQKQIAAKNVVIHEKYQSSRKNYLHDIAIIFLKEKIVTGPNAKPITIDTINPQPNQLVISAGWGATSDPGGGLSSQLLKVNQNIADAETCKKYDENFTGFDGPDFCVFPVRGKSICYGDSGGPLLSGVKGKYKLLGITSHWSRTGRYCADGTMFPYFTHVSYYLDWLKSKGVPLK
ncbi:uncharacterized protein VTP21DRAFT_10835 [Calcarisporiella thermophila]|uniref:uncharacterized protein n=1 Tax=Calcarisporiella thermophila TaxID=911321 RepID=UPI00374492FA